MPTAIRLKRTGTPKRPTYRLVVIDKERANSGGILENLGSYQSRSSEAVNYTLAEDKILSWLKKGALPSESARTLLDKSGIWKKFKAVPEGAAKAPKAPKV